MQFVKKFWYVFVIIGLILSTWYFAQKSAKIVEKEVIKVEIQEVVREVIKEVEIVKTVTVKLPSKTVIVEKNGEKTTTIEDGGTKVQTEKETKIDSSKEVAKETKQESVKIMSKQAKYSLGFQAPVSVLAGKAPEYGILNGGLRLFGPIWLELGTKIKFKKEWPDASIGFRVEL